MSAVANQKLEVAYDIGVKMSQAGLPAPFVRNAIELALDLEGAFDLLELWRDEDDLSERDEIIADLQDLIDDVSQHRRKTAVYVRFDDLEDIARDVRAFKDSLLREVQARGGITKLAGATGMPQPSLSRFFNSASMPRRGTLLKIAEALDLDAVKVATEWTRE